MVVGNQHIHARLAGGGHTRHAGNPVIHRDDEVRALAPQTLNDTRRQAVAELETIGDEEAHVRETERLEAQNHERRAGGPIRVEVSDDDDPAIPMAPEQVDTRIERAELPDGAQPPEREIELYRGLDLPAGEDLPENGVGAGRPRPVL